MLWSPSKTLKDQKGNCFNYSILLASLLIGAGYDAYVVCGYATREVCDMDESRTHCPLLIKADEKKVDVVRKEVGKYSIKPPKDLNSKYLAAQDDKQKRLSEEEKQKLEQKKEETIAALLKPPPDPLFGLRIHVWVLVLSGKREVPETFFIETLSGIAKSTKDDGYLGIESVWNHTNYWVNMQRCYDGSAVCIKQMTTNNIYFLNIVLTRFFFFKGLIYDLGDCTKWEFVFPSNEKPLLSIPNRINENDENDDEEDEVFLFVKALSDP